MPAVTDVIVGAPGAVCAIKKDDLTMNNNKVRERNPVFEKLTSQLVDLEEHLCLLNQAGKLNIVVFFNEQIETSAFRLP